MRSKRIFTKEELDLIANPAFTASEVGTKLNVCAGTIYRARKAKGFVVPIGAKKDKPNVAKERKEIRICKNPECAKTFVTTRAHKKQYCSRSCNIKVNNPAWKRGPRKSKETTPAYRSYSRKVHTLSHKVYLENIDLINPNRYPRTLCGVVGGWQLDHIIPIKECFKRGMSPEEAAVVTNLRMLPWKENLTRKI